MAAARRSARRTAARAHTQTHARAQGRPVRPQDAALVASARPRPCLAARDAAARRASRGAAWRAPCGETPAWCAQEFRLGAPARANGAPVHASACARAYKHARAHTHTHTHTQATHWHTHARHGQEWMSPCALPGTCPRSRSRTLPDALWRIRGRTRRHAHTHTHTRTQQRRTCTRAHTHTPAPRPSLSRSLALSCQTAPYVRTRRCARLRRGGYKNVRARVSTRACVHARVCCVCVRACARAQRGSAPAPAAGGARVPAPAGVTSGLPGTQSGSRP